MEYPHERIAHVCHEALRAYTFSLGDYHLSSWERAPLWLRDATIAAVLYVIEHPEATPETEHARWMADRLAHGWRHGERRSESQGTHPALVPWAELSLEERRKDALLVAIVRALIEEV